MVDLEEQRDQAVVRQPYIQAQSRIHAGQDRLHPRLVYQKSELDELKVALGHLDLTLERVDYQLDRGADIEDRELLVREDGLQLRL